MCKICYKILSLVSCVVCGTKVARNHFCLDSDVAMEIERWVGGTFVSIPRDEYTSRVLVAAHSC